jgi:glycosyltransferase involved in cell wall biosynthesis
MDYPLQPDQRPPPTPQRSAALGRAPTSLRTLVILPTHNEQHRIGPVVRSVRDVLPQADVVVINDDSTDHTAREALEAGASVLPHAVNLGYGAGLETGYRYALAHGYDALVQMDGDGQHPALEIPHLLEPIVNRSADLVIGSRHLSPSTRDATAPPLRRLGQRFFTFILSLLTGRRFTDPTSGFQALNRRALEFLASGVFPCDYPDADVILMALMAGLRIGEVPVRMHARPGGKSMHSGLRPLYYGVKMLLSLFIAMLNRHLWKRWQTAASDTE